MPLFDRRMDYDLTIDELGLYALRDPFIEVLAAFFLRFERTGKRLQLLYCIWAFKDLFGKGNIAHN